MLPSIRDNIKKEFEIGSFIKKTKILITKTAKRDTNKKFVAEISIPAITILKRGAILN